MEKVMVTVTTTHFGGGGLRKVGEQYEVTKEAAAHLKAKGVADYDGPAETKEKGEVINISDKSKSDKTTTAIVEQNEENQGKMVEVSKEKLEQSAEKEKKEITKPVTKK